MSLEELKKEGDRVRMAAGFDDGLVSLDSRGGKGNAGDSGAAAVSPAAVATEAGDPMDLDGVKVSDVPGAKSSKSRMIWTLCFRVLLFKMLCLVRKVPCLLRLQI